MEDRDSQNAQPFEDTRFSTRDHDAKKGGEVPPFYKFNQKVKYLILTVIKTHEKAKIMVLNQTCGHILKRVNAFRHDQMYKSTFHK